MWSKRFLPVLLLAACGGASAGHGDDIDAAAATADAAPAGPDAGPVTISGSAIDTYIFDSGEKTVPQDLSARSVEVAVAQGTGYIVVTGTGTAQGTFTIADVPPGDRLVGVGRSYIATSSTSLDLGTFVLGRPDKVAADSGTDFSVDLDGLDAPAATDLIELYSSNLTYYQSHELGAGKTKIARQYHPEDLVSSTAGDRVTVAQLAARSSSKGKPYLALTRIHALPAFSMVKGEVTATPAATMTAVAPSVTATLDWRRSIFHALRSSVHPQAVVTGHSLIIYALPGQPRVTSADTPDVFMSIAGAGGDDLDYGMVSFGDPYPESWPLVADVSAGFSVSYTAPGATMPIAFPTNIYQAGPLAGVSGTPIGPRVSPPRAPVIAGRNATVTQSGVGVLPLIAWTDPATGVPDYYGLTIYELGNSGGKSTATQVVTIYTRGTSVRVPPQRLQAGKSYFARISAWLVKDVELDRAPFKGHLPEAGAAALTATFSP